LMVKFIQEGMDREAASKTAFDIVTGQIKMEGN